MSEKVGVEKIRIVKIHDGTVIDHIRAGKALEVLKILGITGEDLNGVVQATDFLRDINLKTFVLATCPSCPVMVYQVNGLAYLSFRVTAEIIEANTFVDLATRFTVGAESCEEEQFIAALTLMVERLEAAPGGARLCQLFRC